MMCIVPGDGGASCQVVRVALESPGMIMPEFSHEVARFDYYEKRVQERNYWCQVRGIPRYRFIGRTVRVSIYFFAVQLFSCRC